MNGQAGIFHHQSNQQTRPGYPPGLCFSNPHLFFTVHSSSAGRKRLVSSSPPSRMTPSHTSDSFSSFNTTLSLCRESQSLSAPRASAHSGAGEVPLLKDYNVYSCPGLSGSSCFKTQFQLPLEHPPIHRQGRGRRDVFHMNLHLRQGDDTSGLLPSNGHRVFSLIEA